MVKRRGNLEGNILRRKDGRWMAQLGVGWDPATGKRTRLTFYGRTRQEVVKKLARAQSDVSRGTFVAPHKLTVGEWLTTWLRDYKRPSVRPVTYDSYAMLIRVHLAPALSAIALKDLRPDHIQRLYNAKRAAGLSARTVRYIHNVLHGALRQAMKNQLVVRNVSEATTPPTGKPRTMRPLSLAEVKHFLSTIREDRLFAAMYLALGTGLRRGELLGLRWKVAPRGRLPRSRACLLSA